MKHVDRASAIAGVDWLWLDSFIVQQQNGTRFKLISDTVKNRMVVMRKSRPLLPDP